MELVGTMLPLAVVVGLSPLPIMPAVLLLMTPRAMANALAYLAAWLGTLALLVVVAAALGREASGPDSDEGIGWVQVVTGGVFLVMAVAKWIRRPRDPQAAEPPKWMSAVASYTPRRSAGLGAALAGANPKNLIMALAAGAEIAVFVDQPGARLLGLLAFVLIGSIGILVPVVLRAVLGARAVPLLTGLRQWLDRHSTALTVGVLLVLGVLLLVGGLSARR